jgi:MoxR-like ATPase
VYLWLEFPGVEKEREIIALKVPELEPHLQSTSPQFVSGLRKLDLHKAPSIAETLDWARALRALQIKELNPAAVRQTLNLVLKHEEDLRKADSKTSQLLAAATKIMKNFTAETQRRGDAGYLRASASSAVKNLE